MDAFIPLLSHIPLRTSLSRPSSVSRRLRYRPCRPSATRASLLDNSRRAEGKTTKFYPETEDIIHEETDQLISSVSEQLTKSSTISQSTLDKMVYHLADSRGMARLGLVEAFGKISSPAVPTLVEALALCPNPVIRRSSGKALAKIADPIATPALIDVLLNDEDRVSRSSAAGALARMGCSAMDSLIAVIASPEANMTAKGHAAWAIAFMQGDVAEDLLKSLRHPDENVRIAIISALGAVAIGDALPVMAATSNDDWAESDEVKSDLRERAIAALATALDDDSTEVRAEVATALANAGCTEQVPRIVEMLDDDDIELKRSAALALMKLGGVVAVDRLWQLANDENEAESVRSVAQLVARSLERVEEEEDW